MKIMRVINNELIDLRVFKKPNLVFNTNEYSDSEDLCIFHEQINPFDLYYENKQKDKEIERLNNKIKEQSLLLIEFQDMEQRLKEKDNIIDELERESYLGMLENQNNNDYAKGLYCAYEYINQKIIKLKEGK